MNRLLIAGTRSDCGKTTVTCSLLSALLNRGITPTAFKCGPDYIDPMFHRSVTGIGAYNLDPFFLDGDGLRTHLARHAGELSVIEGAMGYYDGVAATEEASAYTVARETGTPVVLVVSAKGAGHSLGAVIEGFVRHRCDSRIHGVIFNHAGGSRHGDLKRIAEDAGVAFFGSLPHNPIWTVPSRHLGLLTAGEIENLQDKLSELGRYAENTLDLDGLLKLAATVSPLAAGLPESRPPCVRLAVARDQAFCFLYEENLEILEALGCELVFFSPLADSVLPPDVDGLYLCGGYPELHTLTLANNESMRRSIRLAIESGLPAIAESGGFLYLHENLDGAPMCGVIRGKARKTERLQRFGYITLIAGQDNLLCQKGGSIRSHEFRYWDSDNPGSSFTAHKAGREWSYACVHTSGTLYAGFPHLYFPANVSFAKRFVERMLQNAG